MITSAQKLLMASAGAGDTGGPVGPYDYETGYGTPTYTITTFPSTSSTGSSVGVDLLIAVDANIALTDDGVLIDLGGSGGAGTAIGVLNGTMRARSIIASGSDWGSRPESTQVEADISSYCGSSATYYFLTDISTFISKLYVQPGGQGSSNPIVLLGSDTSNGAYSLTYGADGEGYGRINTTVADLTSSYEVSFTGTIDEIRFWTQDSSLDVSGFGSA